MADNENNNKDVLGGLGEGLHRVFLAGVGAMATTAEKGREIIDDLVKKGELTVDQGKQLNSELQNKAAEKKDTLKDQAQAAGENIKNAAAGLKEQATSTDAAADNTEATDKEANL